jgi:outer membrane protein assembly factor BamB
MMQWRKIVNGRGASRVVTPLMALVFLAAVPGPAAGGELDSPWPMFRHDRKHTGRTHFTGPAIPTVAWTFSASDGIASSPTIGEDDTIYFGVGTSDYTDPNLYALNPDGSLKWAWAPPRTRGGFFSSAALGPESTLYISSLDGNLYAIKDMGDRGEELWTKYLNFYFALSSPVIGEDDTLYVGSPSFQLFAIDRLTGHKKWSWWSGWCIISSPAIGDDGLVYVGSKDHYLYALDPVLKMPTWSVAFGRFYDGHLVDSSPAIAEDGTIYVGTDPYGAFGQFPVPVDTSFWAVNPDGTIKWSFDTLDGVESSPAIGHDGTIYFGSYDKHLYAVTDEGYQGTLKWKFLTGGVVDGSPAVDGDGVIYFGSRDATVYALNPDGTIKWTFAASVLPPSTTGDICTSARWMAPCTPSAPARLTWG